MQRNVPHSAARAATGLLIAAALSLASLAHAQTPAQTQTAQTAQAAQPLSPTLSQAAPPVDPTFSAYSLAQTCKQKTDNVAQGQCVGAIRGIIHGYQYGVLFLGQRTALPANETQRVSLCLRNVQVSSIVDEFVADAAQVNEDSLKHTPAEVAVLGSVHMHHSCN
ncbi:Rap1a/Tai family immunity protein [Paraburkholderia aromaticivorans]|uniref:Rap1a/Tai family immunity protein n=1 Tax=Paraburkholderia aromaticivorans TaxID=2026199 RepID=UPI001455E0FB|nr:Rap1a/Tai family immunity protein [Paraburkholderia aromaticivorans]